MVKLNADAMARFHAQAGPMKSTKKQTKTKTTVHNQRPPAGYDCIKFECIYITPRTKHTFVFEATGNVPILTLKQQLAGSLKMPVDFLQLTMFDVELTHGTLNDCGVPEDCTLFVTDEREDVSAQMEAYENFDSPAPDPLGSAFESDEDVKRAIKKAKKAGNFHDMMGGMADRHPKKKKAAPSGPTAFAKSNATWKDREDEVKEQTRPADIGAVDSQLVSILQKMSAGQLRKVAEKQGIKVNTWNKKVLIETLVNAENAKKSGGGAAPPSKPLPKAKPQPKKAAAPAPAPAKKIEPKSVEIKKVKKPIAFKAKKEVKPAAPLPKTDLKYMSAKELRAKLTDMGIKPTSWNKAKLIEAVQSAEGGSEPAPAPVPKVKVEPPKQPSKQLPARPEPTVSPPDASTMAPPAPPVFASNFSAASSIGAPEHLDIDTHMAPPTTRDTSHSTASVGAPDKGLEELSVPPVFNAPPAQPPTPPAAAVPPTPPPQKKMPPTPPPQKKAPPPKPVVSEPPPAKPEPAKPAPKKKKGIGAMAAKWDAKQKRATAESKANPFSKNFDKNAGRENLSKIKQKGMPEEGSLSYQRMKKAQAWARGKIDQLYVEIPKCPGAEVHPDGTITCKFLSIFEHYAHIDSVITGTLKSAKKKGFCHYDNGRPFPLLQQTYDDDVIVTLCPRSEN